MDVPNPRQLYILRHQMPHILQRYIRILTIPTSSVLTVSQLAMPSGYLTRTIDRSQRALSLLFDLGVFSLIWASSSPSVLIPIIPFALSTFILSLRCNRYVSLAIKPPLPVRLEPPVPNDTSPTRISSVWSFVSGIKNNTRFPRNTVAANICITCPRSGQHPPPYIWLWRPSYVAAARGPR